MLSAARGVMTPQCAGYGKARVPLTCGEFVQGNLAGLDFLVSCPVDLFSWAEVWLEGLEKADPGPEIRVLPPEPSGGAIKAARALELALKELGCNGRRAWLKISRSLPPGKGFGSSTADIAAASFAAARALGREITPQQVARIALSIEATDGTMFPGLTLFDHRMGRIARPLGPPPTMRVRILDLGGEVDTGGFNRRADLAALNARKEPRVREALQKVVLGIRRGDPWLLGEGATGSAVAHQSILPKEGLEEIAAVARRSGAYGVVAAHSGTLVGILLPPEEGVKSRVEESLSSLGYLRPALGHLRPAGLAAVVGGGVIPDEPAEGRDGEGAANEWREA